MELADFWTLIKRSWIVLLICSLLGAAIGVGLQLRTAGGYASTIRIYASSRKADNILTSQTTTLAVQRLQSYVKLVDSTRLSQQIVDRLSLDQSAQSLASSISGTVDKDTVLLAVRIQAPTSESAEAIARVFPTEMTSLVRTLNSATAADDTATTFSTVDGPKTAPVRSLQRLGIAGLIGLILGGAIGLLIAALRARLHPSARTPDDVSALTGLPILGVIPDDRRIDYVAPSTGERWTAYQRAAINLRPLLPAGQRVVVIGGAGTQAGATSTTAGLAAAYASSGERVLVVDATGSPTGLFEAFGVEGEMGLAEVLSGTASLDQAIVRVPGSAEISLLPASSKASSLTAASRRELSGMLHQLRGHYDVILVDLGSVLGELNSGRTLSEADLVLLVTDQYRTKRGDLRAAAHTVRALSGHSTGVVLNKVVKGTVAADTVLTGMHVPVAPRASDD